MIGRTRRFSSEKGIVLFGTVDVGINGQPSWPAGTFGRTERFQKAIITFLPWNFGGLSLGLFIFMADHKNERWTYNTRIHEYGHTFQCLLLGPLYWLVIALPSAIWCNCFQAYRKKHQVSYYALYCEKWANAWGERFSGLSFRGEMK